MDPTHKRSKFNYAALLLELPLENAAVNHEKGVKLLEELWNDGEWDPKVAARLANFFIDQNRKSEAVVWYERAVSLNRHDFTNLFNLALTLNELKIHHKSLHYVEMALQVSTHPLPFCLRAFAIVELLL